MIGKLKGIIDSVADNHILLDVSGVCYLVFISNNSRSQLPPIGEAMALFIETHVREDHINLYGFVTKEEQDWFNLLTTVKGVGTKMALSFLSSMTPAQISLAIASKDDKSLTQVSGVGKKLAERAIIELKDKIAKFPDSGINNTSSPSTISSDKTITDAVSALTNLGYSRSDSYLIVTKLFNDDTNINVEELIKTSLGEISK